MKTIILTILICGTFLSSCSVARLQTNNTGHYYFPSNPDNISVYSTDKTGKTYVELGEVIASVEAFGKGTSSVKYLKREAAQLGANGIINLKLEIGVGEISNSVTAKGTAVRFIN